MTIIKLGAGEIPLKQMCYWLDQRCYSKDLAIEYIKNTYEIDITKEIEEYKLIFERSKNVFEDFEEKFPPKKEDDGTRRWFNSYGRNRYLKFYNRYVENDNIIYDEIVNWFQHSSHVHHIFPLEHGGKSNPKNLIGILLMFHNVLHKNPLEHIEKYCYQAVDYLKYLATWRLDYLVGTYNLNSYKDNPEFGAEVLRIAIEKEMDLFYENLIYEYEKED